MEQEIENLGDAALTTAHSVFTRIAGDALQIERRALSLVLTPKAEETFAVTLYGQGEEIMIAADRWHAHFDDIQQAVFCAWWLFTPFYRLVQEYKGGLLAATWLEAYELNGWQPSDPVFFLNPEHSESWKLVDDEQCIRRYWQQQVLIAPISLPEVQPQLILEDGVPPGTVLGQSSIICSELRGHQMQ